jgi:hypothetical protein
MMAPKNTMNYQWDFCPFTIDRFPIEIHGIMAIHGPLFSLFWSSLRYPGTRKDSSNHGTPTSLWDQYAADMRTTCCSNKADFQHGS